MISFVNGLPYVGILASGLQSLHHGYKSLRSIIFKFESQVKNSNFNFEPEEVLNFDQTEQGQQQQEANNLQLNVATGLLFGFNAYRLANGELDILSTSVACASVAKTVYDCYQSSSIKLK